VGIATCIVFASPGSFRSLQHPDIAFDILINNQIGPPNCSSSGRSLRPLARTRAAYHFLDRSSSAAANVAALSTSARILAGLYQRFWQTPSNQIAARASSPVLLENFQPHRLVWKSTRISRSIRPPEPPLHPALHLVGASINTRPGTSRNFVIISMNVVVALLNERRPTRIPPAPSGCLVVTKESTSSKNSRLVHGLPHPQTQSESFLGVTHPHADQITG